MLIGKPITVIGGGVGGLAVALACAQGGAAVTVLEQAAEIAEVGAGIQVSPNGWVVLKALGVAEALSAQSIRSTAVRLRDFRRGTEVFAMPLTGPFHLVHRADLIDVLHHACLDAGVEIRLNAQVAEVEVDGAVNRLTFADGGTEDHGLTLAADGLNSAARRAFNPRSKPFFTGQVAWRATLPGRDLPPEAHVFMGPGRHLVRYPLRGGVLTNIVAVEERDQWAVEDWAHLDDPKNLRAAFTDFCPEIRDLLADVQAPNLWGLFRHPVAKIWHSDNLALLGDAAHPTLPFLAQGANLALEDAFVLARCLSDEAETSKALAAYAGLRKPRALQVIEAANDNATNYHLRPGPLRFAAHSALRLASRYAPHVVANRYRWIHAYDATR
ncbi:FAD-dependent monooxygenase [Gymnodinialimonas hymeniacidonis]|uniref:FAD-dependent monooxygenase n=1 Tax=Gymnodinialimonas hymeniacidonis TaxID=3126508 RepID=UPI0034C5C1A0